MSLTPDPLEQLRQALLAQSPNADWNAGGVDRAAELAKILSANGITDLSKLSLGQKDFTQQAMSDYTAKDEYGNPVLDSSGNPVVNTPVDDNGNPVPGFMDQYKNMNVLQYGDKTLGNLSGMDPRWLGNDNQLAWSAAGNGNASFNATKNPDGTTSIVPVWGSSSDAGLARDLALKGLLFAGGAAAGGAFGGAAGSGATGNGAFLGEGAASGVPAWDAATGSGVLGGAAGAGEAVSGAYPGVAPAATSGPGLLGSAGKFLAQNPSLAKLVGAGVGGLLGRAVSGPPNSGSSGPASVVMNPRAMTPGTETMMQQAPSQGLPSGLGSSSAGLFDEYMKKQLNGGRRIFGAPTFGGG